MNISIHALLINTTIFKMLQVVHAERWYVDWIDLKCQNHEVDPKPFWSLEYGSKKECCEKVFWWREWECTSIPMPSPSPTLRGAANHPESISGDNDNVGGSFCPGCDGASSGDGGTLSTGSDENSGNANADGISGAGTSSSGGYGISGASEDESISQNGNVGQSGNIQQGLFHEKSVHLAAIADTYIRIDRPEKNYGKKKHLIVGTDGETATLIKFDLKRAKQNLSCVDKAILSLYSLSNSSTGGLVNKYDPRVFPKDKYWDETHINWSSAPKDHPYKYYKEIGAVRQNRWIDVDITNELGTDRFVTFHIVGGKWNKFASKESRYPPILTIDFC